LTNSKKRDWLEIEYSVRFGDLDAAGVIHFYQLFRWCHEAWEKSLDLYGISPTKVFPSAEQGCEVAFALPIVHCKADFLLPIKLGDKLILNLNPKILSSDSFSIDFKIIRNNIAVAYACIVHVSITPKDRQRCQLPEMISQWIRDSSNN
tara:strand:+ start:110 stop:556 length:447 start_codon:yes stop_codon:yes gene_type:complete